VFEVISHLDEKTYAVKKIKIETENKSFKKISKEIDSVINEIRCMVKIQSENVVEYFQSWIEAEVKEKKEIKEIKEVKEVKNSKILARRNRNQRIENFEEKLENLIEKQNFQKNKVKINVPQKISHFIENNQEILLFSKLEMAKTSKINLDNTLEDSLTSSEYSGIDFKKENDYEFSLNKSINADKTINSNDSNESNDSYSNLKRTSRINSLNSSELYYLKAIDTEKKLLKEFEIKSLKSLTVYIQMELCKETLGEYVATLISQKDITSENFSKLLKLFADLIKAVNHIHEKEKIIHRDLKPNNIFLSHDNKIKLGDFGLATEIFDVKYKKFSFCESDYDTSSSRKNSDNSTNSNSQFLEYFSSKHTQISYHTKNVGTLQYASPEQLNNNFYDNKSDIFSLGLILFEMIYPIKTGMEKHKIFSDLKKRGKIPESLEKKYPIIAGIIKKMVDVNPIKRPDVKDILIKIEEQIRNLEIC
jgi:serine/threonine protein kinase